MWCKGKLQVAMAKDLYSLVGQRYRDGKDAQQARVIKDRDENVLPDAKCDRKMERVL